MVPALHNNSLRYCKQNPLLGKYCTEVQSHFE